MPILAPIFLKINFLFPAKVIYFIYSFFCHQYATRSIHLFDYQFAWCVRDTGIWIGILFGAVITRFSRGMVLKLYHIPIFALPILLDGGLQFISSIVNNFDYNSELYYVSNNFLRFLTGSFFGFGVSLWLSPKIINAEDNKTISQLRADQQKSIYPFDIHNWISKFKKIFLYYLFLPLIYIVFIQLWYVTSNQYIPTNFFDSIPKVNYNIFARRENGLCPTHDIDELLDFSCFLYDSSKNKQ
ncbi:MAG: DUF2085 domain-containing protein [Candidatus Dojkabacteria bacterium]|nr:DUF2085 domain-containing protein [Candidatus Dojkabacteria bacterium]